MNDTLKITITGSHAQTRKIKESLGRDPNIHSGFLGKGRCCGDVTPAEFYKLKDEGFKVALDRRFKDGNNQVLASPAGRLEVLRIEVRAERMSYGELAELESLASHIPADDVEMLQWANVPEDMDERRAYFAKEFPGVTPASV
jgi:hypothetical protein